MTRREMWKGFEGLARAYRGRGWAKLLRGRAQYRLWSMEVTRCQVEPAPAEWQREAAYMLRSPNGITGL